MGGGGRRRRGRAEDLGISSLSPLFFFVFPVFLLFIPCSCNAINCPFPSLSPLCMSLSQMPVFFFLPIITSSTTQTFLSSHYPFPGGRRALGHWWLLLLLRWLVDGLVSIPWCFQVTCKLLLAQTLPPIPDRFPACLVFPWAFPTAALGIYHL